MSDVNYRDNYKYRHIATTTTTDVSSVAGSLVMITVNTAAAGSVTVYDASSGNTTATIAILKASVVEATYHYNLRVANGIQIVTAANTDLTVVYTTV